MPSSNSNMSEFKSCFENVDDIINQLSHLGKIIILGDINAQIGQIGGSRSLTALNSRGCMLGDLMKRHRFISLNLQEFAEGPLETCFQ